MNRLIMASLISLFTVADAGSIRPLLQISFGGGGDELVTIQHDYDEDYTIDAGDGLAFEAGMAIESPANNLEMQFLIGYRFYTDDADNGDITWDTVPLSAIGFVKMQDWKFGLGLTYHLDPEMDGRFGNDSIKYRFDDALGGVMQIQYSFANTFDIGIRATFIEYQLENDHTQTANGNSIGVVGTFKFGGTKSRYQ